MKPEHQKQPCDDMSVGKAGAVGLHGCIEREVRYEHEQYRRKQALVSVLVT